MFAFRHRFAGEQRLIGYEGAETPQRPEVTPQIEDLDFEAHIQSLRVQLNSASREEREAIARRMGEVEAERFNSAKPEELDRLITENAEDVKAMAEIADAFFDLLEEFVPGLREGVDTKVIDDTKIVAFYRALKPELRPRIVEAINAQCSASGMVVEHVDISDGPALQVRFGTRKERAEGSSKKRSAAETLHEKSAKELPIGTALEDKAGTSWKKTAENEWKAKDKEGKELKRTDAEMDRAAREGKGILDDEQKFEERIREMPEVAKWILRALREIMLYVRDQTNARATDAATMRTQITDLQQQRQQLQGQIVAPGIPEPQRRSFATQMQQIDRQLPQAERTLVNFQQRCDSAIGTLQSYCAEQGYTSIQSRPDIHYGSLRIQGNEPQVRALWEIFKDYRGRGASYGFMGSGETAVGGVRIPLNDDTLERLSRLRFDRRPQMPSQNPVEMKEVATNAWERVFPFKEVSGAPGAEGIIVSFSPALVEQAMGLASGSIRKESFMIQNIRGRPSFPEGGYRTNLQGLSREEQVRATTFARGERQLADYLGIRAEQTDIGTKVIVPEKLRGKGVMVDGVRVA
jgi:hypothetical protein